MSQLSNRSSKKGTIEIPTLFHNKKKAESKFKFIDLFAGIGGTRIGFEYADGQCVFSSEWDKDCQKTYQANFGEVPYGDITKIKAQEIPDFDVLVAGFPCQPFSTIGKRQGFKHATQGTLFYDIVRILEVKKPISFLLENVPGLKTHDGGNTFAVILSALEALGYEVFHQVLNGADFGVPQQRKRIYIVGFKKDKFNGQIDFTFPVGKKSPIYIGQFIEENVQGYSISKHLQETYMFKVDDGKPEIVDPRSKIYVKTLVSSYHKIQRLTGTFVSDGETGLRLLTENECKAIMGFPQGFIMPVSRTQKYRQLGNSVVVPAVKAVAKAIAKKIEEVRIAEERLNKKNEEKNNTVRSTIGLLQAEPQSGYSPS